MPKKNLSLNTETLRLLASSDAFEAIATDKTAEIAGGRNVPKPGRSGWRGCPGGGVPKPGPSGMQGCSLALACPAGQLG